MKAYIKLPVAVLVFMVCFLSCTKKKETTSKHTSVNNTSWIVSLTFYGNTTTQNIFEFSGDGAYFSWHPAGAASLTGTWTQDESTVYFIFQEKNANGSGGYFWDNTGTLNDDNTVLTGTMKRRGAEGSGTFTAKKL